jgi:hypothetical protein
MRENEVVTTLIQSTFGNGNKPMATIQRSDDETANERRKIVLSNRTDACLIRVSE